MKIVRRHLRRGKTRASTNGIGKRRRTRTHLSTVRIRPTIASKRPTNSLAQVTLLTTLTTLTRRRQKSLRKNHRKHLQRKSPEAQNENGLGSRIGP